MRVCLVTPYDLSCDGGVNRHVRALADALRMHGHEASVLGPASGPAPSDCDALPGIVSVTANGSKARIGLLVARRAVQRYLCDGAFDVVHVHEPCIPGIARHAASADFVPRVVTFHTYAERESRTVRMLRRALARPLRDIDHGIAVSRVAATFAGRVFGGSIHLIPNGIDLATFGAAPRARPGAYRTGDAEQKSQSLRVLFVGRYDEPRKGLRYLLAAASMIRESGREIEVRIAGQGNRESFACMAQRAGAVFLGRLSDSALANEYRSADVFCAPATHGESFGLVLVEAMACGCPVVASDIRGYREASNGAAMLAPPSDPRALAHALRRMADDHLIRQQAIGHGSRRAQELSWTSLASEVVSVYESAVAGGVVVDEERLDAVRVTA
jgi:phosphatidyl-myo-inositol alpha-mannosyltransferase